MSDKSIPHVELELEWKHANDHPHDNPRDRCIFTNLQCRCSRLRNRSISSPRTKRTRNGSGRNLNIPPNYSLSEMIDWISVCILDSSRNFLLIRCVFDFSRNGLWLKTESLFFPNSVEKRSRRNRQLSAHNLSDRDPFSWTHPGSGRKFSPHSDESVMTRRSLLKKICTLISLFWIGVISMPIFEYVLSPLRKKKYEAKNTDWFAWINSKPTPRRCLISFLTTGMPGWFIRMKPSVGSGLIAYRK